MGQYLLEDQQEKEHQQSIALEEEKGRSD